MEKYFDKMPEIGAVRVRYRGSEEDYDPTMAFLKAWREELDEYRYRCYIKMSDVNYAVDEKVDGAWQAHWEVEAYFGAMLVNNAGGGLVFFRENPEAWFLNKSSERLKLEMTLPYRWFYAESEKAEPGFIALTIITPIAGFKETTEALLRWADRLRELYDRMIQEAYAGSRTEIDASNDDAEFTIKISSTLLTIES